MADRPERQAPISETKDDHDPFASYRDGGKSLPRVKNDGSEGFEQLSFGRRQEIQQLPGESSEELRERLRPRAEGSFKAVRQLTQIDTHSWYTFDASKILGIKDAVAIVTSTCKHGLPYHVFVGVRGADWDQMGRLPSGEQDIDTGFATWAGS